MEISNAEVTLALPTKFKDWTDSACSVQKELYHHQMVRAVKENKNVKETSLKV